MKNQPSHNDELLDWIDALENLLLFNGHDDSKRIVNEFISYAKNKGLVENSNSYHPFENSISHHTQAEYPGNLDIEKK